MVNAPEGSNLVFFRKVEVFDRKNSIFSQAFDQKTFVSHYSSTLSQLITISSFLLVSEKMLLNNININVVTVA